MFIPRDVIVNELAPIIVNWLVRDDFIASIAVRIPTNAIIPNAIMHIVSIALTLLDLIARNEIFRFSLKMAIFNILFFIYPISGCKSLIKN
jgi:hypothetical protein